MESLVEERPRGGTGRVSDVLIPHSLHQFSGFARTQSNAIGFEAARLFSLGLANFVCLVGPSGYGKTHLLEACAILARDAEVLDASQWCGSPRSLSQPDLLILDNLHEVASQSKIKQAIRIRLERRLKAGKPTLLAMTSTMPLRFANSLLPTPKDWIVAQMLEPNQEDRQQIIIQICENEDVQLGRSLIQLLASRLVCNGNTYVGIIKRLKLVSSNWKDPQLALKACGIIDPFFSDASKWDLREAIMKTCCANRIALPRCQLIHLALYLMLFVAHLNETHVAQFFGIESGEAFAAARQFQNTLQYDLHCQEVVANIALKTIEFLLYV